MLKPETQEEALSRWPWAARPLIDEARRAKAVREVDAIGREADLLARVMTAGRDSLSAEDAAWLSGRLRK